MKQALWIAGLVLVLAGLGFRWAKHRAASARVPVPTTQAVATTEPSVLPPSQCPMYTLNDNGVCIPVPRAVTSTTD